jgi:hypothetical protein
MTTIPKILHQIWIGPKPAPTEFMKTWKEKHPDFQYILWNEREIQDYGLRFVCQKQIEDIGEINGKADIIRWEILYQYGGYFVDADSICIEPFDEVFEGKTAFATFENENMRKGLIATGTMGFIPQHPLCRDIIQWISTSEEATNLIKSTRAWFSVGPGLLTKMLETGKYRDATIFPSHYFLPNHFTGYAYTGHKKVYGYQEWGTAKQSYDTMNAVVLPQEFLTPPQDKWYSVVITSYNTERGFIRECLESIKQQTGYFGIEVVWVDDGSTPTNSEATLEELERFKRTSRFTRFMYLKNAVNVGPAKSSNRGLKACSSEIVFKMDSDDLMLPDRMSKQISFMTNSSAVICGANIRMFSLANEMGKKIFTNETRHPEKLTWYDFYRTKPTWIMNHPTFCFRKTEILAIGGYNENDMDIIDDYELLVRILKKYNVIYNLPDVLLYYRIHENQMSQQKPIEDTVRLQHKIIENILKSEKAK